MEQYAKTITTKSLLKITAEILHSRGQTFNSHTVGSGRMICMTKEYQALKRRYSNEQKKFCHAQKSTS